MQLEDIIKEQEQEKKDMKKALLDFVDQVKQGDEDNRASYMMFVESTVDLVKNQEKTNKLLQFLLDRKVDPIKFPELQMVKFDHKVNVSEVDLKESKWLKESLNSNKISLEPLVMVIVNGFKELNKKEDQVIDLLDRLLEQESGEKEIKITGESRGTRSTVRKGHKWIKATNPSQNATYAKAKISIKLNPGIHKYTVYGNDGTPIYFHGLNLFFDGDTKKPRVSVYAPTRTSLENIPVFLSNNSPETFGLEPSVFDGVRVPGAGTTIYNNGKFTVELKDFFFAAPDVFQTDRTKSLPENPGKTNLLVADGKREFIGSFTLQVTKNVTLGGNKKSVQKSNQENVLNFSSPSIKLQNKTNTL